MAVLRIEKVQTHEGVGPQRLVRHEGHQSYCLYSGEQKERFRLRPVHLPDIVVGVFICFNVLC